MISFKAFSCNYCAMSLTFSGNYVIIEDNQIKIITIGVNILNTDSQFFKESEAAAWLRVSVMTLRNIRKAGQISYYRISNKMIRYSLEQLQEYQQKHLKQAV